MKIAIYLFISLSIIILGWMESTHSSHADSDLGTSQKRAAAISKAVGKAFVSYNDLPGIGGSTVEIRSPNIDGGRLDGRAISIAATSYLKIARDFPGKYSFYQVIYDIPGTDKFGNHASIGGGRFIWNPDILTEIDFTSLDDIGVLLLAKHTATPAGKYLFETACREGHDSRMCNLNTN